NHSISTESLRDALLIHFARADIDAVPLNGIEASEVDLDAKRKECDYILYTDLTDLRALPTDKTDGMSVKTSEGSSPKETFQVRIDFRLLFVGTSSPELASSVIFKNDGPKEITISMALKQEAGKVATTLK